MYLTPLQDWRHILTYKSRNDDPLDDGKEELCMLTATFWSAQLDTARKLELFFFFFFRFSQTGLVGTGVHGCRERGALNVRWGRIWVYENILVNSWYPSSRKTKIVKKTTDSTFPLCYVILCCAVASQVREVLAGRCSWGRRFSHRRLLLDQAARQPFHVLTPIQCNPKVHDE